MDINATHEAIAKYRDSLTEHVPGAQGQIEAFEELMKCLGLSATNNFWDLYWAYSLRRTYHNHHHICGMFCAARMFAPPVLSTLEYQALLLAIVFHDAVYEVNREPGYNERASMEVAGRYLDATQVHRDLRDLVDHCILVTITHTLNPHPTLPAGYERVAAALIDLDLMGLGASPEDFATATERLWNEFSALAENATRAEFDARLRKWALRFLTDRPHPSVTIFQTEHFKALEIPARRNLASRIRALS